MNSVSACGPGVCRAEKEEAECLLSIPVPVGEIKARISLFQTEIIFFGLAELFVHFLFQL